MTEKNEEFFKILEDMADVPNRFRDIEPLEGEYPDLEPSDYKWYHRYKSSPDEVLSDYVRRRIKDFPKDLRRNLDNLTDTLDTMMNTSEPLEKRTELLLKMMTMKKMGHAGHPGLADAYVGQTPDPSAPTEYYNLDKLKSMWDRE